MPIPPSSPVAVQTRRTRLLAVSATVKSTTGSGGILSGPLRAFAALMRAPVTHRPSSWGTTSAELNKRVLAASAVMLGNWPLIKAKTPATCGVAMEVPPL